MLEGSVCAQVRASDDAFNAYVSYTAITFNEQAPLAMPSYSDLPSLVRQARRNQTQREFAKTIGATQSMVSRYERGVSSPPVGVVNACMHQMHTHGETADEMSVEQLASLVINRLGSPEFAAMRVAIAQLINGVSTGIQARQAKTKRRN